MMVCVPLLFLGENIIVIVYINVNGVHDGIIMMIMMTVEWKRHLWFTAFYTFCFEEWNKIFLVQSCGNLRLMMGVEILYDIL